jgi:hypothetical protein
MIDHQLAGPPMDDMDQSAGASGDAGTGQDWPAKYTGLQRVLNRRQMELVDAQSALEQAKAMAAEQQIEIESYRARDRAANEEADAERTYEALRTRFEPEPPTALRNNGPREPRGETTAPAFSYKPNDSGFPT